jgi:selenocysteine-specific elongation factor
VIIGTAGHIDHGKTALVRALTGIDTDRLPQEKARGITIELGFASLPLADGSVLGFVDVPGHERLVRTMLAGAAGIDHALLVVAADDGPMPQTREHLAILQLLGVPGATVALTKRDRVDAGRLQAVAHEVRALLAGTPLADAPVLPVSSTTGTGLDALRERLAAACRARTRAAPDGLFRLAVDRVFTLAGIGTVLAGTASTGRVAPGDRLLLSPSGLELRVRGVQVHHREVDEGRAGQRLALQVGGLDKAQARRGDWLLAPALHAPTGRLDARLRVLDGLPRGVAHWTPVRLHLGADEVGARVLALEGRPVEPGGEAMVRLELERPLAALHGDRFVLRDPSALGTLGGGTVLDTQPPPTRRHRLQRLAALRAMALPDPAQALAALLALQPPHGVDWRTFAQQRNLAPAREAGVLQAVPHRALPEAQGQRLFAPGQLEGAATQLAAHLEGFHRRSPDSPGLTQRQLLAQLRERPAAPAFAQLLQSLVREGTLRRNGPHLALAAHAPTLQGAEQQAWERLKPWLEEAGMHPPKLGELLQRDPRLRPDLVLRTLQRLQRMGQVHAVGADYFIPTAQLLALALAAKALADQDPQRRLNLRELRERVGISRHLCVPLVEFFDQIGLTSRDAVGRHFRRDPRQVFET